MLSHQTNKAGWRDAARQLLSAQIAPDDVQWQVNETMEDDLFTAELLDLLPAPKLNAFLVPKDFIQLADTCMMVRDPARFHILYQILWRLTHGEKNLLKDATDPLIFKVNRWVRGIRRDIHKMHAFVRFKEIEQDGHTHYIAWFEPEHYIVEAATPFFMKRFANMHWSIFTPDAAAHWNTKTLSFGPGATREQVPHEDALEEYWRSYFKSIFNPARLKVKAMMSEMPKKYWHNLPEAQLIPELIQSAQHRMTDMINAAPSVPKKKWQKLDKSSS